MNKQSYKYLCVIWALIWCVSCHASRDIYKNIDKRIASEYRTMLDVVSLLDTFPNNYFELKNFPVVTITQQLALSMLTSTQNQWDMYGLNLQYDVHCMVVKNGHRYLIYTSTDGYFEKVYAALDPAPGILSRKLLIFESSAGLESPSVWFEGNGNMLYLHSLHRPSELWLFTHSTYNLEKGIKLIDSYAISFEEEDHIEQKHEEEWETLSNDFYLKSLNKPKSETRLDKAFGQEAEMKIYRNKKNTSQSNP